MCICVCISFIYKMISLNVRTIEIILLVVYRANIKWPHTHSLAVCVSIYDHSFFLDSFCNNNRWFHICNVIVIWIVCDYLNLLLTDMTLNWHDSSSCRCNHAVCRIHFMILPLLLMQTFGMKFHIIRMRERTRHNASVSLMIFFIVLPTDGEAESDVEENLKRYGCISGYEVSNIRSTSLWFGVFGT